MKDVALVSVSYGWMPMFLVAYIIGFFMYYKTLDIWLSAAIFAAVQVSVICLTYYLYA
jgi:hypothetical protein